MAREIELDHITVIVPKGRGQEVLDLAKMKGITNGTVTEGYGTANREILEKLMDKDLHREIVSVVTPTDMADIFLALLKEKFEFGKPGKGISYATNVTKLYGEALKDMDSKDRDESEIQSITAIVRNVDPKIVMEAARKSGAKGGTILVERNLDEDMIKAVEKSDGTEEVIIILAKKDAVRDIMNAITGAVGENNGVIYCQDVRCAHGLKK